eukprot:157392_1
MLGRLLCILLIVVVLVDQMQDKFKAQVANSYGHEILVSDTIKRWKNRESVYLWNVVCIENKCNINTWDDRMTWLQYTNTNRGHYNIYHKQQDAWTNGEKAGKVATIMDHIKVVSIYKIYDDPDNDTLKKSYKEWRFVEIEDLSYIDQGVHMDDYSQNNMDNDRVRGRDDNSDPNWRGGSRRRLNARPNNGIIDPPNIIPPQPNIIPPQPNIIPPQPNIIPPQ